MIELRKQILAALADVARSEEERKRRTEEERTAAFRAQIEETLMFLSTDIGEPLRSSVQIDFNDPTHVTLELEGKNLSIKPGQDVGSRTWYITLPSKGHTNKVRMTGNQSEDRTNFYAALGDLVGLKGKR